VKEQSLFFSFVFFGCVCLPVLSPVQATDNEGAFSENTRYKRVLSLIYNYDLAAAERAADSLIAAAPDAPKPYFFSTLARWWYFVGDFNSRSFKASFLESAEQTIDIGKARIDADENDVEARFYLGAGYGYLARYYVFTSDWPIAFYYGKKSKNIFADLLDEYDTLYDANLTVGAFNYYADKLPAVLKIFASIAGLGGDKQLGFDQLRLAADSGRYSRVESLSLLGYIDLSLEGNFREAVEIFSRLSAEHQSNPVFRSLLSNSYRKSGDYNKAISTYRELLDDGSVKYVSANQLAGLHAELGYCYMLARDYGQAIREYKICDSLAVDDFVKESPWVY
jgi:tetratricopeptide (TPR) repeat protein